ncbi:DNA-binding MarR family transcriptional regulator [Sinobacterium caligoides]|uniref:DNA-binding MarR family transcriptional regulator n=1 Tax=Sinobacterium caligoides TaxID=933926 RepID=A0A3N2DK48_9GAMM|nr:MarR family transcriptional regulator [Sinobacterium caligoides]ROS00183.1 DNA-binding MarR family transcriptional regulator [Sinobacterium caligoides]
MDKVDEIIEQWNQVRPDLDVSSMSLVGRFKRITQHLSQEMTKTFAEYGLNAASFDVLATLLRTGPPYALSPNDLLATMMVTSGTMTNRIDQLSKSGLVERMQNPDDARSVIVSLTEKGFAIIDSAVTAHVATQDRLTSGLTEEEHNTLNKLLRKFLGSIEE